jgi:hypothetical protein
VSTWDKGHPASHQDAAAKEVEEAEAGWAEGKQKPRHLTEAFLKCPVHSDFIHTHTRTHTHTSKVLYIVTLCRKYSRALTSENSAEAEKVDRGSDYATFFP